MTAMSMLLRKAGRAIERFADDVRDGFARGLDWLIGGG